MFISNADKLKIAKDIGSLQAALDRMLTDIQFLSAKVKVLEGKKPRKTAPKKKLTEAQRQKQREYARKYQAKKRLEKQNVDSISTTGQ